LGPIEGLFPPFVADKSHQNQLIRNNAYGLELKELYGIKSPVSAKAWELMKMQRKMATRRRNLNICIMRWRPNLRSHTFDWMGERYGPLVDSSHFLGRSPFDIPWHETPAANVSKQKEKVVLEVSVPGFTKDDLEIVIKGRTLIVKGEKPHRLEKTGVEYIMEEFSMDSFERKFKLADEFHAERMEAKCENGVLRISFFKETIPLEKSSRVVAVS
jgi:HSP20 family protein